MKTRIPQAWLESLPKLRAISIRQPFAELVLRGDKPIEYRSKVTHVRGRVYVYASLGRKRVEDWEEVGIKPYSLPTGVIVGTVEVVDCTPSDTYDGEYDWHLARPERLDTLVAPKEHPQPIWFYPFGKPEGAPAMSGALAELPGDKTRRKRRKSRKRKIAIRAE